MRVQTDSVEWELPVGSEEPGRTRRADDLRRSGPARLLVAGAPGAATQCRLDDAARA
jgi:hypothetical protein